MDVADEEVIPDIAASSNVGNRHAPDSTGVGPCANVTVGAIRCTNATGACLDEVAVA